MYIVLREMMRDIQLRNDRPAYCSSPAEPPEPPAEPPGAITSVTQSDTAVPSLDPFHDDPVPSPDSIVDLDTSSDSLQGESDPGPPAPALNPDPVPVDDLLDGDDGFSGEPLEDSDDDQFEIIIE